MDSNIDINYKWISTNIEIITNQNKTTMTTFHSIDDVMANYLSIEYNMSKLRNITNIMQRTWNFKLYYIIMLINAI